MRWKRSTASLASATPAYSYKLRISALNSALFRSRTSVYAPVNKCSFALTCSFLKIGKSCLPLRRTILPSRRLVFLGSTTKPYRSILFPVKFDDNAPPWAQFTNEIQFTIVKQSTTKGIKNETQPIVRRLFGKRSHTLV